jgi:hypothetical protein
MRKLILVSILFAMVVLPIRAATDPSPRRGLRRALVGVAAFNVLYLLAVLYVLPRLP